MIRLVSLSARHYGVISFDPIPSTSAHDGIFGIGEDLIQMSASEDGIRSDILFSSGPGGLAAKFA